MTMKLPEARAKLAAAVQAAFDAAIEAEVAAALEYRLEVATLPPEDPDTAKSAALFHEATRYHTIATKLNRLRQEML